MLLVERSLDAYKYLVNHVPCLSLPKIAALCAENGECSVSRFAYSGSESYKYLLSQASDLPIGILPTFYSKNTLSNTHPFPTEAYQCLVDNSAFLPLNKIIALCIDDGKSSAYKLAYSNLEAYKYLVESAPILSVECIRALTCNNDTGCIADLASISLSAYIHLVTYARLLAWKNIDAYKYLVERASSITLSTEQIIALCTGTDTEDGVHISTVSLEAYKYLVDHAVQLTAGQIRILSAGSNQNYVAQLASSAQDVYQYLINQATNILPDTLAALCIRSDTLNAARFALHNMDAYKAIVGYASLLNGADVLTVCTTEDLLSHKWACIVMLLNNIPNSIPSHILHMVDSLHLLLTPPFYTMLKLWKQHDCDDLRAKSHIIVQQLLSILQCSEKKRHDIRERLAAALQLLDIFPKNLSQEKICAFGQIIVKLFEAMHPTLVMHSHHVKQVCIKAYGMYTRSEMTPHTGEIMLLLQREKAGPPEVYHFLQSVVSGLKEYSKTLHTY